VTFSGVPLAQPHDRRMAVVVGGRRLVAGGEAGQDGAELPCAVPAGCG